MRGDVSSPTRGAVMGFTLVLVTAMALTGRAQGVRYVDGSVVGSADGSSWANAYTNLAAALAATGGGTNLWVARGTYRDAASFQLKSGVGLYGGFTNGMATLAERDWTQYPALLDGQGARTVLLGANNAILDGFVITNGAAAGGGGLYNNAVAPTVRNCVFTGNAAGASGGGAVYNNGEAADAVFINCTFRHNTASGPGGAIFNNAGDPALWDCAFVENRSTTSHGGAIYNSGAVVLALADCTFTSNRAASHGGAIFSPSANTLTITNGTFTANRADQNGGVLYIDNNTLAVRGSRFVANQANTAGAIYNQQSSKGLIEDCVFAGNQATNGAGGAYNGYFGMGMLTNRHCTFAGNTATSPTPGIIGGGVGGALSCSGDNSVYEACTFSANRAAGAGGAIGRGGPDYASNWTFRRCVFAGNESGVGGGVLYANSSGEPRFENSVLAGNVSAVGGGAFAAPTESASAIKVLHCTFSGNRATTSGGAALIGSAYAYLTNSIFWGNSAGTGGNEIHQQIANRAIVGYSDVQGGWTGLGTNNLNIDPSFDEAMTGAWTAVAAYDPAAGQTALTDGNAAWGPDAYAGRTVNPDTTQWLQFVVASNTIDTLYVWGNARVNRAGGAVADAGDGYRMEDFRLQTTSPLVDAGIEMGLTNDLAGAVRPREAAPDPGAYEVQEDVMAPAAIADLLAVPLHLRVELSWLNPSAHDLTGVLAVRREGLAPTGTPETGRIYMIGETLGDGVVVHTALATGWSDGPLNAGTDYHYRLFAFDDVGNYAPGVGTTAAPVSDTTPPAALTDLTAAGITGAIHLAWTNPLEADFSGVLILRRPGTDPTGTPETGAAYAVGQALGSGMVVAYGPAEDATPGAANAFTNTGLADATAYHYAVFAFDPSRNYSAGALAAATTATDVVPPADVTGLTFASDDSWIQLAWTNPPDPDFEGVLVLRRTGAAPSGAPTAGQIYAVGDAIDDGQVVFAGLASTWRDEGVTNGVEYFYAVHARDEVPNYSAGVGGSETPVVRHVRYVDWQATGANDGSTWADAFTSLTAALTAVGSGTNLWVAAGTYKPGVVREASFVLKAGVGVLGGFTNGMSTIHQRDWNVHVTVLSGDLNDNEIPDFADVYHVVTATWATNAVLDGVTVTCGYAHNPISDTDAFRNGGGLYLWMSDVTLTIRNSKFINNTANYLGGAVAIRHVNRGTTGVVFSNCVFRGNSTFRANDGHGGAIYHLYRPLTVVDSIFEDNAATLYGGAIVSIGGDPILRNSTFARNTALNAGNNARGGAIYHDRGDLVGVMPAEISNCRFYANRASVCGGADFRRAYATNDLIRDSDFFANETTAGAGGALFLYRYDSVIANCRFSGNTAGGASVHGGGLYLNDADTVFRNVVLAGNVSPNYGGAMWADGGSRLRFENALVAGNQARYSGGGMALYDSMRGTNVFLNCTIVGNRTTEPNATYGGGGLFLRNGVALITNTIFHGNLTGGTGTHVRVDLTADVAMYGYGVMQGGLAGTFAVAGATNVDAGNNLSSPPLFIADRTGTWTASAAYTNASGLTVLTDAVAMWAPGKLTGLLLNPSINAGSLAYVIATNTATTVSVMGMATNVAAGASYRIHDYRLQNDSPAIDSGLVAVAPTVDLAGVARPQGSGVDRGVYERVREGDAPAPVTGLSALGGMDQVTLVWTNPLSADFAGVLIVRRQGMAPTGTPVGTNEYVVGEMLGDDEVVYVGWGANGDPGQANSWVNLGVPAEQTFHYVVFAYDLVPNYATGAGASATTLRDPFAPGPVSGVGTIDSGPWLMLTWTNPPDIDFAEVLIVRREGAAPTGVPVWTNRYTAGAGLGDGTVVYQGPGSNPAPGAASAWLDTGTQPSVAYGYRIFAADEVPNYSTGVVLQTSTRLANVLFVDAAATGLQNGRTWADAFSNLHTALAQATTSDVLWVAAGTYTPGPFQMRTNGAIYGGFTAGMSKLGQRIPWAHPTILSGGGPVVRGAPGSRLDGFTVTGGNAVNGGGYYMSGGTVTVANCVFRSNQATRGGGLYLIGVNATIERCRIENNVATSGGGGLYAQSVYVAPAGVIRNSVFVGNRCEGAPDGKSDGGGIALVACPYRLESCTFHDNVTSRRGGAIKIYWGNGVEDHVIKNCILWNNRLTDPPTGDFGGWEIALQEDLGYNPITLNMSYTVWSPDSSGDRLYNYFEEAPTITALNDLLEADPAFADAAGGDLHLKSKAGRWQSGLWVFDAVNSPCIDAGNPNDVYALEPVPNGGRINMGAYGNTDQASRSGEGSPESGFLLRVR